MCSNDLRSGKLRGQIERMAGPAPFTIVTITHPDQLRDKEVRSTINSYSHKRQGRRPRPIILNRKLAIPWTIKTKSSTPAKDDVCDGHITSKDNKDQNNLPRIDNNQVDLLSPRNPSPLTIGFAGTRRDPFAVYPIPIRGCVEEAVDFWLNVWVPSQITGTSSPYSDI